MRLTAKVDLTVEIPISPHSTADGTAVVEAGKSYPCRVYGCMPDGYAVAIVNWNQYVTLRPGEFELENDE